MHIVFMMIENDVKSTSIKISLLISTKSCLSLMSISCHEKSMQTKSWFHVFHFNSLLDQMYIIEENEDDSRKQNLLKKHWLPKP